MVYYDIAAPLCFDLVEEGRYVLFLRADYRDPLTKLLSPLNTLWDRLGRATEVARGRGMVARWPLPERDENVILRRYAHGGLFGGLLGERFWGISRPLKELALSERARESGVAIPLPLGLVVERGPWPTCRAVYVSAEARGSEDMVHFCCRMAQDPPTTAAREKRATVSEAARQVRALHDAGIDHVDLHLKNLLVQQNEDGTSRVSVIDLDKARERNPRGKGYRLKNLMRLARSVRKLRVAQGVIGPRARLRFLREYLRGMPEERVLLREWARRLARSGQWREGWWSVIGADREAKGDRMGEGKPR